MRVLIPFCCLLGLLRRLRTRVFPMFAWNLLFMFKVGNLSFILSYCSEVENLEINLKVSQRSSGNINSFQNSWELSCWQPTHLQVLSVDRTWINIYGLSCQLDNNKRPKPDSEWHQLVHQRFRFSRRLTKVPLLYCSWHAWILRPTSSQFRRERSFHQLSISCLDRFPC